MSREASLAIGWEEWTELPDPVSNSQTLTKAYV